ncbi:hypothetical protein ACQ4PT_012275 [Festuca glaucescens]
MPHLVLPPTAPLLAPLALAEQFPHVKLPLFRSTASRRLTLAVPVDGEGEAQCVGGCSEEGFGSGGGGDWGSGPIMACSGWRRRLGKMRVTVAEGAATTASLASSSSKLRVRSIVINTELGARSSSSIGRASRGGTDGEAWSEEVCETLEASGSLGVISGGSPVGNFIIGFGAALQSPRVEEGETSSEAEGSFQHCSRSCSPVSSAVMAANSECPWLQLEGDSDSKRAGLIQLSYNLSGRGCAAAAANSTEAVNQGVWGLDTANSNRSSVSLGPMVPLSSKQLRMGQLVFDSSQKRKKKSSKLSLLGGEELDDHNKKSNDDGTAHQGSLDPSGQSGVPPRTQSFSLGNNTHAMGNDQFSQRDQAMAPHSEDVGLGDDSSASAVFQLLVQKGVVDKTCAFVWDNSPKSAEVASEVKNFSYSEKMLSDNFHQRIEDASADDVELPDDIMPDSVPSQDEGIATVVGEQSVGIDDCDEPAVEVDYPPLNIVRPESMESGPIKCPGGRFKKKAQRTTAYKRKKMWPAASKSAKSDKDDNFVTTRKRGRPAGSKSAKSKMGRKPALAYISSSDSEGERDEDDVYDLTRKRRWPTGSKFANNNKNDNFVPTHLSRDFCRSYLPQCNTSMTLEDEDGQMDYVNYLSARDGLSGGWRGFAIDHSLKVGDTVVFELVEPTKFKVYIRRENESTTTEDNVRSKEDPGFTTRDSSSAPGHDIDNLAGEEAVDDVDNDMEYPDSGIKDSDGITTRSSTDKPSVEREGYEEVMLEKDHASEKMKALKSMMAALKDGLKAVDVEVEELESSVKKIAQAMQQMLNAQW